MSTWVRVLIVLLMTLPIAGYVTGTLVSTAPEESDPPDPVRLRDAEPSPDRSPATPPPRPEPAETPSHTDTGEVRVLTPKLTDIDDDDDDDGEATGTDDDGDDGDAGDDDAGEDGDD